MKYLRDLCLMGSMIVLLTACKEQKKEENVTLFSLSDTMMNKCQFEKATTSQVKNEIKLFGKITANNNKVAQINPVVSGVVKNINVGLGDYVRQGKVLAVIQSSEVATFRKERLDAVNDLAIGEKSLSVAKELFAGKLNSEKDVAAAEREVERAKAELERIDEVFKIYNLRGGSTYTVQAPISGFITSKNLTINEQLRLDQSEPLFTISEINEIWAVANVHESDISKIEVDQDVSVKTLAFPDMVYNAKIEKIYNVIDPETKAMKIRAKIPNNDYKLKPEMNCTVEVHYNEGMSMITVPSSSVIFDKSKYWVMVFNSKTNIETREVEIFRQLGDVTYIRSGLKDGETVISQNGLLVYDALND